MKDKAMDNAGGCGFCRGRLSAARRRAANFILRRMGFAARESFDLHCAALRAAVGNNEKGDGGNANHSAFADVADGGDGGGGVSFRRRLSAMAVALLGEGVNAVSREEFDAHCQILAAAEAKAKKAKANKAKSGNNKSPNKTRSGKGTKAATTSKEA